jgi:diaminohydroxyphosphoribosylaminopyrimidine deaminase / 5-amino-6-(5-phosphoribosylamino)uracil reductase
MLYDAAMLRAIELGRLGLGETSPNPSVGALILDRDGNIAGEGRTAPIGGPHAEINALKQAGERAHGGVAVVTLEPCNHTGLTGPCSLALIKAGVSRVVVAVKDPTLEAAGGLDTLRAAGVETIAGVREADARHSLRYWLTAVARRRPYVVWKFAATLDGRSAAADGTSRWITSEASREDVHRLRATVDAVIAGVGTVLADDPALTVRWDGPPRRPLRVVVDSDGRTPLDARVRDDAAPTWIATTAEVGRHDIEALLAALYRRGVRAALLEGGPTLAGAFLQGGFIDEVVAYLAPKLLGAGPAALGDAGIKTIADVVGLEIADVTSLGPDVRITGAPKGVR